ncbi:MAG: hypothetical protein AAGG50_15615 [Bacteroidota bacterium]
MRPIFLTIALLVLAATPAVAQPALSDSTSAVLFSINGLALNTYEGGFGYLRRLSPRTALLVSLGGQFRRNASDAVFGDNTSESTATNADLRLQTDLRVYARSGARTSLYVQGGPFVGWRWSRFEDVNVDQNEMVFERTSEQAFLSLGGNVQAGVAYRLSGMFEVSGAYVLNFTYVADLNREDVVNGEVRDRDESAFEIDLTTTRLTLAVYF